MGEQPPNMNTRVKTLIKILGVIIFIEVIALIFMAVPTEFLQASVVAIQEEIA